MKLQQAPQPILVKLLALDQHAATLADAADDVASKLEYARALLNGKIEDRRVDLKATQAEFERLLVEAPRARARADAEQRLLSNCKLWLERLPHNTPLEPVHVDSSPRAGGEQDLADVRSQLAAAQREITALRSAPVAADDIAERVDRYVAELGSAARPLVHGFGPGEQLQVHFAESAAWSNRKTEKGFNRDTANPLLLAARLLPQQLAAIILAEITALTEGQDARPPRIAELEQQCAQLRRLEEAAIVTALAHGEAVTRDPNAPAWAVLEVQVKNDTKPIPTQSETSARTDPKLSVAGAA